MSKVDNLTDYLTDLGNTIRTKKSKTDLINPQDFSDEISSIDTAKPEQAKIVTYTSNGTYAVTPDEGYTLAGVRTTVNVPEQKEEEVKRVSYTRNGTRIITPSEGKVISQVYVTVNVPGQKEEQIKNVTYTSNDIYTLKPDPGKVLSEATVRVKVSLPQLFIPTVTVETPFPIIHITDDNGGFLDHYAISWNDGFTKTTEHTVDLSESFNGYGVYDVDVQCMPSSGIMYDSDMSRVTINYHKNEVVLDTTKYDCQPVYDARGASLGDFAVFLSGSNANGNSPDGAAYNKDYTLMKLLSTSNIIGLYPAVAATNKYIYIVGSHKETDTGTLCSRNFYLIDKNMTLLRFAISNTVGLTRATACKIGDDGIIVAGGVNNNGVIKSVFRLTDDGVMTTFPELTTGVMDAMSGAVTNDVVLIAGGHRGTAVKTVTAYNKSGTKVDVAPMAETRVFGGCTKAGNKLLIAGGIDSQYQVLKSVDAYNENFTHAILPTSLDEARWDVGSATINGTAVFVTGFYDYSNSKFMYAATYTVDMYDSELTHSSTEYFSKFGGVACVALADKILTYGGRHNDGTEDLYTNTAQGFKLV